MQTTVYLVVFLFLGPGHGTTIKQYPMLDMDTCYNSIENSKTFISNGNDSEGAISLFCIASKK